MYSFTNEDTLSCSFSDFCSESLGLEDRNGGLPDAAFTASSSYDSASVGPQNGR